MTVSNISLKHRVVKYGTSYTVHNQDHGASEKGTVVLIHGIGDWSFRFACLVESLKNTGFQVVTYDMLGRGYSPTAANRQAASLPKKFGDDVTFLPPLLNMQQLYNFLEVVGPCGGTLQSSMKYCINQ